MSVENDGQNVRRKMMGEMLVENDGRNVEMSKIKNIFSQYFPGLKLNPPLARNIKLDHDEK